MQSGLQFIITPAPDTEGTIVALQCNASHYLFGHVPEGTQRGMIPTAPNLVKTGAIFLTGKTNWTALGGFMGLILGVAQARLCAARSRARNLKEKNKNKGKAQREQEKSDGSKAKDSAESTIMVMGPPNLGHMLATSRSFLARTGLPLEVEEIQESSPIKDEKDEIVPAWKDENICVWPIAVSPKTSIPSATAPAGYLSPRKRTYDELDDSDSVQRTAVNTGGTGDQEGEIHDGTIKSIVSTMFPSGIGPHGIVEMPLAKVEKGWDLLAPDPGTGQLKRYFGPLPWDDAPLPSINVFAQRSRDEILAQTLPAPRPRKDSVSYIVRQHRKRGRFNPERAKALGLEPGPLWRSLTNSQSVQNPRGELITPEMVLGKEKDGQSFAVIDLPSDDYVEPLLNREELKSPQIVGGLTAFIWLLGPGVISNPKLRNFMDQTSHSQHIVSAPDVCADKHPDDTAAELAAFLNQIAPDRFALPLHFAEPNSITTSPDSSHVPITAPIKIAQRGLTLALEPSVILQEGKVLTSVDVAHTISKLPRNVRKLREEARSTIAERKSQLDKWRAETPGADVEVICLGTGSSLPSLHRNVSATLVRVPGCGSYLLDCGENTLGQLRRLFKPSELLDVLRDLRMIWLSHTHADHFLGVIALIKARHEATKEYQPDPDHARPKRLAVFTNREIHSFLDEYSAVEDFGYDHTLPLKITAAKLGQGKWSLISEWRKGSSPPHQPIPPSQYSSFFGFSNIQAVYVPHCPEAMGVAITFESGFKLSYSGDCRPSNTFAKIGLDSTLLIHEATFDDELSGEAIAKRHSTTSEALAVGAAMKARAVLLTHFSQRYHRIPVLTTISNNLHLENGPDEVGPSELVEESEEDDSESAQVSEIGDTTKTAQDLESSKASEGVDSGAVEEEQRPDVNGGSDLRAEEIGQGVMQEMGDDVKQEKEQNKAVQRDMKVCVAFDYLRVKVGDIPEMECYLPALDALFPEDKEKRGQ